MKLLKPDGKTITRPVSSALVGQQIESVTLTREDFEALSKADPKHIKQWVISLLCRFP